MRAVDCHRRLERPDVAGQYPSGITKDRNGLQELGVYVLGNQIRDNVLVPVLGITRASMPNTSTAEAFAPNSVSLDNVRES